MSKVHSEVTGKRMAALDQIKCGLGTKYFRGWLEEWVCKN